MQPRSHTHPSRDRVYTNIIYGGPAGSVQQAQQHLLDQQPAPSPYRVFWGEIHGHTELSDGTGSLDDYFRAARDQAGLDFCAVTDHDHGGPGREELWGAKWQLTQDKIAEYHDPPRFVTILGYERDSWPWYSNLCLYYRHSRGEMVRGEVDGEITRDELAALLARDDIIAIPHHTAEARQGVCFDCIPPELMTPLTEVCSKWGASEYFGNPKPVRQEIRGGHWRDALETGAHVGCVGGSDVHSPHPGMDHRAGGNLRHDTPGLVAVLAKELSREAVFDAMRQKRCYAAMGARIAIDFRINGAHMGQVITCTEPDPRRVFLDVHAEGAIQQVDLIKNGRDYYTDHVDGVSDSTAHFFDDLRAERATDYYYLRVTQEDGRRAWSSPIWVENS